MKMFQDSFASFLIFLRKIIITSTFMQYLPFSKGK